MKYIQFHLNHRSTEFTHIFSAPFLGTFGTPSLILCCHFQYNKSYFASLPPSKFGAVLHTMVGAFHQNRRTSTLAPKAQKSLQNSVPGFLQELRNHVLSELSILIPCYNFNIPLRFRDYVLTGKHSEFQQNLQLTATLSLNAEARRECRPKL